MATERAPFSVPWVLVGVLVYTAMEIAIAAFLAPVILTGRLASPMLQMRLQMLMHLGSFYLGGLAIGVVTPGARLIEPAVSAFIAVAIVFLMSFFMPTWFMHWSTTKVIIGGGLAAGLAVMGAYTGEKWMGNVERVDGRRGVFGLGRRRLSADNSSGLFVSSQRDDVTWRS